VNAKERDIHLEKLIGFGATAQIIVVPSTEGEEKSGPRILIPTWPIDYLYVREDGIEFFWIGPDQPFQIHVIHEWMPGENGAVLFKKFEDVEQEGRKAVTIITIAPVWNGAHANELARWARSKWAIDRGWPSGGWSYKPLEMKCGVLDGQVV